MENTTIRLNNETKQCLDDIKVIRRETYDDVIRRVLVRFLNSVERHEIKEDNELNDKTIKLLKRRLKNVNEGNVISTKELKKRLFGGKKGEI